MKKLFLIALSTMGIVAAQAQFTMDAEIRPRSEYRLGTKDSLSVADTRATSFTSQRTRLNLNYKSDKYTAKVTLQDVRNWGTNNTLQKIDNTFNSTSYIQEAWANIKLVKDVSLKLGRQEISYDDHRIFGNVGWAQQARTHDLGILKYKGFLEADFGFTFQGDNGAVEYQDMKYLRLYKSKKDISISGLVLDTDGLLTAGTHVKAEYSNFNAAVNYYLQKQENDDATVDASTLGLDLKYKLNNLTFGLGYEQQSGNSKIDNNGENNAFNPLFGTNHKFNGLMDYFYVGNHAGSVGLQDIYFNSGYKYKTLTLKAAYHIFSAAADLDNGLDAKLGNEIDLSLSYKHSKDITIKLGHSLMSPTESMIHLRGGHLNASNHWTWIMFVIKPKLI